MSTNQLDPVALLSSFNRNERKAALSSLLSSPSANEFAGLVNLHFHSFFSFNCENWSPQRIAWEARRQWLFAAGIIDFDVLDGLDEFTEACLQLQLRHSVGIETRAFYREFADKVIDSPGEPGVTYLAGAGFAKLPASGSPQAATLAMLRATSRKRNEELIARINPNVSAIAIDYDADVLPLAPSGNATERHIISAYVNKAEKQLFDKALIQFWSDTLQLSLGETQYLLSDRPQLEEKVRNRFAKRGGFGYVQPTSETFPAIEVFFDWVRDCEAIPSESWLDGTSEGEKDSLALLECSVAKGARALNLIPDRNWNISDAAVKEKKLKNLYEVCRIAEKLHLPLHIGTEMNRKGLPFADNLNVSELQPIKNQILEGTRIVWGHTLLARYANLGLAGEAAQTQWPDVVKRHQFYAQVGQLPGLNLAQHADLLEKGPSKAFDRISEAAQKGSW